MKRYRGHGGGGHKSCQDDGYTRSRLVSLSERLFGLWLLRVISGDGVC